MFYSSQANQLLASLSEDVMARISHNLTLVKLPLGAVLYEPGEVINHVFFPVDSIISLLYVMENGSSAGVSLVGKEGVVGIPLLMGGGSTPSRAVVQSAGTGYQLSEKHLSKEFNRHGEFLQVLLSYTQTLITQVAQTAVCNQLHTINQQLCRWLLLSLDRLSGNKLDITQEMIANMLGVRREGITEAAGKLQKQGVIKYCRGQITVIDRVKLESLCCECYSVIKKETDRLLPLPSLTL